MSNGDGGLKGQFGVGDPKASSQNTPTTQDTGSDKQAQDFTAAFQQEQGVINGHLQYTAVNAESARHDPLAARRDAMFGAFQSALAKIDRNNPSKAQGDIDKVLGEARALSGAAGSFRQQAEKAKTDWDSRQGKYDDAVRQVEELQAWGDAKAPALRGLMDGIRTQTNQRQYPQAVSTLDQVLPKLAPIYEEYLRQKEAKPRYEQQLAEQSGRLDPLKAADRPSQPMAAKAGEADAALGQARAKADGRDFVAGLEQMQTVQTAVDELDKLTNDPERAKFLADIGGVDQIVQPPSGTTFRSQEADWSSLTSLKDQIAPAGDGGDYAGANGMLADLKEKGDAFAAKHSELEQQKQAYEEALAQALPRLQAASVSEPHYAKLQPMLDELTAVQTQAESAAQSEEYEQALTQVQDVSAKLDTLEQAKTEIDEQKQAYETALAEVKPRLDAVSVSDPQYAKLQTQRDELTKLQADMEAAATSGDFARAQQLLEDLKSKLDAFDEARKEIDGKKQEFDDALAALRPKLELADKPAPTKTIETTRAEIVKGKADIDAAALANDYEVGLKAVQALEPKLDSYAEVLKTFEAQKTEYDTALKALQPRLAQALEVKNDKLKDKKDALATGQKTMEAAALLGNYEEALKISKDLATQLDTFEKEAAEADSGVSLGGEVSIREKEFPLAKAAYAKGVGKIGGSVKFAPAPGADTKGAKKEAVESAVLQTAQDVISKGKWEIGAGPKLNPKDKQLSLAVGVTFSCEWGPVKGEYTPIEVSLVNVDPKNGITGPKVSLISVAISYKHESMKVDVGGVVIEFSFTGSFAVEITPDWAAIAQWAIKELAIQTAEGAIAVDGAALASAAAVIVLPLAAAAAIGFGMYQEARNMQATSQAIQTALPARKKAAQAATSYAKVLTGGSGGGDEGSQHAEAQIAQLMKQTNATREEVVAAITKAQGGWAAIRARELQRIKDHMYAQACQAFDEGHKADFGIIERQGPDWGYRGSFRKMLRMILYADD